MPVRPRRRQRRLHLSVREFVDLTLGPRQDSPLPFDYYHMLYHEHTARFGTSSWAFKYFDTGVDDREAMELDPDEPVGLPGAR